MSPKSMISRLKTEKQFVREFFAEFMGTFVLIAIGDGSIASYVLNKGSPDTFAICFCYGVGVLVGVSTSIHISGAHLNPAVTLAFASLGKFPIYKIPHYFVAQFSGGFFASVVVYSAYFEGIDSFGNDVESEQKTASIFATYPATHITISGALIDQTIGTAILLFCVLSVTDAKGINTPKHLIPAVLSLVITAICVAFGLNCGAILNPARDVSPRVFTWIAGWSRVFDPLDGNYWWVAGIVGPVLGGPLGAWIYYMTIELHHSEPGDPSTYCESHENNSLFTSDRDLEADRMFRAIGSTLNSDAMETQQQTTNGIKLTRIAVE